MFETGKEEPFPNARFQEEVLFLIGDVEGLLDEISAGQSKTFSLYGTVAGSAQSGITPYVASTLSASGFKWLDTIGGGTEFTGSSIVNFPTNSWTTAR